MTDWSMPVILSSIHDDIEGKLARTRAAVGHPVLKGDASEAIWCRILTDYLPQRYSVRKAVVADSHNRFSDQIDAVVFDRQYSPFIFSQEGVDVIPVESVYAVFECKQTASAATVKAARDKAASVRRLHRTSLPIPHAGGVYAPKKPQPILGGLLATATDWTPPLGDSLHRALAGGDETDRLDLGCIATAGLFGSDAYGRVTLMPAAKAATTFLFELIARLQELATVPMVDVRAYSRWLTAEP